MTWRPLIVLAAGAIGIILAMPVGFLFTVASGGIEEGDPREYVVAGILVAGMIIGLVVGWWLS